MENHAEPKASAHHLNLDLLTHIVKICNISLVSVFNDPATLIRLEK